jgi:hypothetical protein
VPHVTDTPAALDSSANAQFRQRFYDAVTDLQIRVDSVGALSVTLGTPLNGKKGERLRRWSPPAARARASASVTRGKWSSPLRVRRFT